MWKWLGHPNIVPFVGVTTDPLQVVSEWMSNGTLTEFVNENPGADRVSLVGLFFLLRLAGNIILPRYWMWPKVLTIFTRTTLHMETWMG